jgi:YfiH family protein
MTLPNFVQSPLLLGAARAWHAFCGADPVPGRDGRARLREAFSIPPGSVGTLMQIHSAVVLEMEDADAGDPDGGAREGDALWTGRPGRGVGVRTADCVPVLIAHRELPVAAAVHAGWRGLSGGVIPAAVEALSARFGPGVVDGLLAAAGPCARGCCYEVGAEVADALAPLPGAHAALRKGAAPGKWMADLLPAALAQLRAAGIAEARCDAAGLCTICDARFHSYRRERSSSLRQLSFAYIP